jgi:hypothetical protein
LTLSSRFSNLATSHTLRAGVRFNPGDFQVSRSLLRFATHSLGLLLMLSGMSSLAMAIPASTPEVDPASATSALALLAGAVLLARDKFRRQ